jgi:hypothetical protein
MMCTATITVALATTQLTALLIYLLTSRHKFSVVLVRIAQCMFLIVHHQVAHAHHLVSVLTLLDSFWKPTMRIPIMELRGRMESFLINAVNSGSIFNHFDF